MHTEGAGIIECKARGIFRKEKKKPLVGDRVDIEITDETNKEGSIEEILPRRNELIRPACANIDRALILFACDKPKPNIRLLDRMIIMMETLNVPVTVGFNKTDLVDEAFTEELRDIYSGAGVGVIFMDLKHKRGIDTLEKVLCGNVTALMGPSGTGKSTLTNTFGGDVMEVGDISHKLERGKNTTRHAEVIPIGNDSFIMDTPGFTSFDTNGVSSLELKEYYREFIPYEGKCRFNGCNHVNEPDCAVKHAVENGEINKVRYNNYLALYEELLEKEKRRYS